MKPIDWAILPFKKFAEFTGRSRRAEYWWFALLYAVLYLVAAAISGVVKAPMLLPGLLGLVFLIPSLAVGFRRLHDTNRSAWWLLIGLVPLVGWIVLLVFYVQKGTDGDNQYGSDPIAEPAPAPVVS